MSGIEETLGNILSSPEEMERITSMAKSIMESGSLGDMFSQSDPQDGADIGDNGADIRNDRADIRNDGAKENPLGELLGSIDPAMLASAGKVISSMNGKSEKYAMLNAMAPFLGEKRRLKMEKAIQIAKMASMAKAAFSIKGGDGDV